MISTTEADLYRDVWQQVPEYRTHSPGEQLVEMFLEMADPLEESVLDAGCGTGRGAIELKQRNFDVVMCDVTDAGLEPEARGIPFVTACLWDTNLRAKMPALLGGKFDYCYCCDVMEHVPQEFTMLVVRNLLDLSRYGVFFNISLMADNFGLYVGQPLHQTVKPFEWWRDRLNELGDVVECRDLLVSGTYFVRPR